MGAENTRFRALVQGSKIKVAIVNVGLGNVGSLKGALESLGLDAYLASNPADLDGASHLILPGVGSFPAAMQRLSQTGIREGVRDHAAKGKPLLGICLGMQILASWGDEGVGSEGLGLLAGKVLALPRVSGIRIPHVGWNSVEHRRNHPVLEKLKSGVDYYFVHSFAFSPELPECVYAETNYGTRYASAIGLGSIFGVQFHPEKSQKNGLRLLENFCQWNVLS